ncbi:DUF2252 domain-containing protein [Nocardia bovistercoris]|uniref:DUF2252 domain-containing protein n=1 Tax=Nocardia bovistercoris TaxID=2785916 RepID=A0A931IKR5_9NOCA|nr:DUF2252 domain-containing protein [Nocardia bovistercoris]MBH0781832.1 DUF2252 domain-containing protein [Nocardia bovistercoris]
MTDTLAATNGVTGIEGGRKARKRVSRSALGKWEAGADRVDPVTILERQARTRLPELVPIRYARMLASPFPFLRGAPAVMAADLAAGPDSGLTVQLCGDAHLSNFGLFASPERALLFDLNDFDETLPGPFEWDVKRLVASVAVAARANGYTDVQAEAAASEAARGYRSCMLHLAELDAMDVWYLRVDADAVLELVRKPKRRKGVERALATARANTSLRALSKLTEPGEDGMPRIRHRPPLLVRIDEPEALDLSTVFAAYRRSLPEERRVLLDRHRLVDLALKVVGVGSVGTRCFVALLVDVDTGAPLFLQVKEAENSVLTPHLPQSKFKHQGHRVVHGQRLTQAAADIFLGWATGPNGRYFYWRQLRDMKGSAVLENLSPGALAKYATLCGFTLARAHARSGDRVAIAAYLGSSDVFDRAMVDFALAYADQTLIDHRALVEAADSGRITAAAPGA